MAYYCRPEWEHSSRDDVSLVEPETIHHLSLSSEAEQQLSVACCVCVEDILHNIISWYGTGRSTESHMSAMCTINNTSEHFLEHVHLHSTQWEYLIQHIKEYKELEKISFNNNISKFQPGQRGNHHCQNEDWYTHIKLILVRHCLAGLQIFLGRLRD